MKKRVILFASIFVGLITANAQTFTDDFTGLNTGVNLAGQSSWTKGGSGPDLTVDNATPLTYPGYTAGGSEYAVIPTGTSTSSRVYKTFANPETSLAHSTFYYSVLLRLTSVGASSNGYFMSLGNSGTGTQYGAKLFARTSGAGFNIGVSKTSNTAAFGPSVLELNKTYLIVVRYSFNNTGFTHADSIDDEAYLWVNPVASTEPTVGQAECIIASGTGGTDFDGFSNPSPYNIGNFIWHNRNTTNPAGAFDGVRVGHGTSSALAWANLNAGLTSAYDDPPSLKVKNTAGITLDGKLDEADWSSAPTLIFGNSAFLNKQGSDYTVTGGADVKSYFDVNGVKYRIPNTDSSVTRVKFLRKGTDLYIGLQSNDKSICKFDWEADGLFLMIKDTAGVKKEYKLYYQNIDSTANIIKYEEGILNSGSGAGYLYSGSTANDTTQVDSGYSAELRVRLDKLGFGPNVSSLKIAMDIFDPDGLQFNAALPWPYGMSQWDSARGSYYKSWWGSEWGDQYRTLILESEKQKFDDPKDLVVKNVSGAVTVDGKLDEADWNGAPTLIFGNGALAQKQGGEYTVTGDADVKSAFNVGGVKYYLPNTDSSVTRVKFLRKGTDLYIGLQSNDQSICKFDWEGDGLFLKVKNSTGDDKEYKLYYQNIDSTANTIKYEEGVLNSGAGAGFLHSGSVVNDTASTDSGYTAELRVKLSSLGFDSTVSSVQLAMDIFDPDGYQHPMNPWDSARGSYYKSWWGSEWGGTYRTLKFVKPYDDPDTVVAKNVAGTMTLDGKLDEAEWAGANTLIFGPPSAPKTGNEMTVTGGFDLKASFDVNNVTYHLPYVDTSYTKVKFLHKGTDLYIGIQSPDKSICKFDWEGDGLFLKIKNSAGDDKEYKLYYQNIDSTANTIKYEEGILNSGAGAGFLNTGSTANDTTNIDNGYSAELRVKLVSLGYDATVRNVQVAMAIFDPDGFQFNPALPWPYGMSQWDSARGSYYKSWWGSEWGGSYRTINLDFTTGVSDQGQTPTVFSLLQNYPNPFNPSTTIRYSIPVTTPVVMKIYNVIGQEVTTLVNQEQKAGNYAITFDASRFASGIYIYRIQAGSFVETKKMMLLK